MTVIGITGGSGSGKTTLLQAAEELGAVCIDCDALYHELLRENKDMLAELKANFPQAFEGGFDRKKLGNIVFSDENALFDLNKITHSAILGEVQRQLQTAPALVAIDAIALFESGLAGLCHTTVAITAPEADRVQRLMARDGISREYAQKRIDAQRSNEEFSALCQFTLENNGDIGAFHTKCLAFLSRFDII